MKLLSLFASSWFVFATVASPALAEPVVLNRIVATVDGEPITLHELEKFWEQEGGRLAQAGATKEDALRALITNKLVAKEIETQRISVRDEDIDRYIEGIKGQNKLSEEELKKAIEQEGIKYEDYRKQVKTEIEKIQLLNREIRGKVNITPEEIERHYEANKKEYLLDATVHLRHIVLRLEEGAPEEVVTAVTERANEIRKRIVDDGEDFAEVAKQVSEDAAASEGGDLGQVKPDAVVPEFEEALKNMEEGEVSEPIRTSSGIHILRLEKRTTEGYTPLEEVKEAIKQKLYGEAIEQRYTRWLAEDLQKRHYVETKL